MQAKVKTKIKTKVLKKKVATKAKKVVIKRNVAKPRTIAKSKTKLNTQKKRKTVKPKTKITAKKKMKVTTKSKKITNQTTKIVAKPKMIIRKKSSTKKVKKITEPISFGLLQNEIDSIISENNGKITEHNLERKIIRELALELPKNELIIPIKVASHTDIVVDNTTKGNQHSPFVLDLTAMIEKKRNEEVKKNFVRNFLNNHHKKNTPNVLVYEETKPMVTEIHETRIVMAEVKENSPSSLGPRRAGSTQTSHLRQGFDGQANSNKQKTKKEKNISHKRYTAQFTDKPLFYHFDLPLNWHRKILVYMGICLLMVIPIKGFSYYSELKDTQEIVMNYANTAYQDLKIASSAIADKDTLKAEEGFASANQNFAEASQEIENINSVLKSIINLIPMDGANLADAEYLLRTGEEISTIGEELTSALDSFSMGDNQKLTDRISLMQTKLTSITPKLNKINNNLNKIRIDAIPSEKQTAFIKVKKYFNLILNDIKELNSLSNSSNQILGKDYKRRYLFVFQNSNELRATGGFMGSFALVDIDRGAITKMEIPGGGVYDMQGGLLEKKISPYPLQMIKSTWQMQDANWFPDFPTSAEKIKWFYEKSGGPSVDGVIAINSSMLPKLLEITGPIDMPEYGKTLTSDNFITETQKTVEYDYNKTENKPKQILADLAPKIIGKIFATSGAELLKVISTFKQGLDEKDIQLYFTDTAIEQSLSEYNWTGEIKDTSKDYLAVIHTNIGGYKTDAYITTTNNLVSEINEKGEIANTLTITRTHNGTGSDLFGNKNNIDYMRIYVPENSKLISAEGFSIVGQDRFEPIPNDAKADELLEKTQGKIWVDKNSGLKINNEFDKTIFANWLELKPGETKTVTVKYQLPFILKLDKEKKFSLLPQKANSTFHSLYLQKQSGSQNTDFNITIKLPSSAVMSWTYPGKAKINNQEVKITTPLLKDELVAFVIE